MSILENSNLKISFTGSRLGMSKYQKALFRDILKQIKPTYVCHGDCIGADKDFHDISRSLLIPIRIRPCDIFSQRAFCKDAEWMAEPEKPLLRNRKIVNDSDLLLASPGKEEEELRSGTWSTIRYAIKITFPYLIIFPSGKMNYGNL